MLRGACPGPRSPTSSRAHGCRMAARIGAASGPRSSSSRAAAAEPRRSPETAEGLVVHICTDIFLVRPLRCGPHRGSARPARPAEGFPGRGSTVPLSSTGPLQGPRGSPEALAAFCEVPSRWRHGSREQHSTAQRLVCLPQACRAPLSLLTPFLPLTPSLPRAQGVTEREEAPGSGLSAAHLPAHLPAVEVLLFLLTQPAGLVSRLQSCRWQKCRLFPRLACAWSLAVTLPVAVPFTHVALGPGALASTSVSSLPLRRRWPQAAASSAARRLGTGLEVVAVGGERPALGAAS